MRKQRWKRNWRPLDFEQESLSHAPTYSPVHTSMTMTTSQVLLLTWPQCNYQYNNGIGNNDDTNSSLRQTPNCPSPSKQIQISFHWGTLTTTHYTSPQGYNPPPTRVIRTLIMYQVCKKTIVKKSRCIG